MKVLFFGTPQIAVPYLSALADRHTVVGAVCRPDEPVGRGHQLTAPPVKQRALELKVPVFQPAGPWEPGIVEALRNTGADVGVVVAYGRLLPEAVFTAPLHGCFNIHYSLLPKYRGAAPMQWALINGEAETGVSAFWLEAGLDRGAVAGVRRLALTPADDILTLRDKLVPLGLELMHAVLDDLAAGRRAAEPQTGEGSHAPQLKKEDGRIDWTRPAAQIMNLVRGVREWPGAQTRFHQDDLPKTLKLHRVAALPGNGTMKPGVIVSASADGIVVGTGEGFLRLAEVQPEGRKPMAAWAFWQGARLNVGDRLG